MFIDITNFTKQSYLASFTFATLFGAKLYYVEPEKYEPIDKRIADTFSKLKDDPYILSEFKKINRKKSNQIQKDLERLLEVIKEKYIEKVQEEYKYRGVRDVLRIPLSMRGLIKLTSEHERILYTILERTRKNKGNKDFVETITELAHELGLKGKNEIAKVSYRVKQLVEWGFINITKPEKGRKKIILTEFGEGYSQGLCEFEKEGKKSSR